MVDMGCSNQGLAGNASEMETVPAQLLFHEKGFAPSWAVPAATVKPADPPPKIPISKSYPVMIAS